MSQHLEGVKAALDRRAEKQLVPDGFMRCPLEASHIIPIAMTVAHIEHFHACDDLALAEDAMYSTRTRERCQMYHALEGTNTALPADRNGLDDPDDTSSLRSCSVSSGSSRSRRSATSSVFSSDSSFHYRRHRRRYESLTCVERRDVETQTDAEGVGFVAVQPPMMPCFSGVSYYMPPVAGPMWTSSFPEPPTYVPQPQVLVSPSPPPSAPVTVNPLAETSIVFTFDAAEEAEVVRAKVTTLLAQNSSAETLLRSVEDIVAHQGKGLIVCTSTAATCDVRRALSVHGHAAGHGLVFNCD